MDLPDRSGVAVPSGADAITEASSAELLRWLRALKVPEPRVQEVERLDHDLRGFQRLVLRYGVVRALVEKGYALECEDAQWKAYDAAMRARLGEPSRG